MIDLKDIPFKTLSDPIYIGRYKIDEIWKGNKKVYPEMEAIFRCRNSLVVNINNTIHVLF